MKYSVITFGCRVNQADSLAIEAELRARGAESVPAEGAELVIVNTCSVTASADQGARQTIRRIARENPHARIVATGCYATRCADEVAALPGVIAVIPNDRKLNLVTLEPWNPGTLEPWDLGTFDGPCGHAIEPGLMGRTAWTLRAQTGCEEHCSYCIIPTTRGASRSRSLDDVFTEVDRVTAAGYREIVITGVHLGSYGRDLAPRSSLSTLLTALLTRSFTSPILFRISSLEPMDCTPAVLETIVDRGHRNLCAPHFHLPIQHASNRMLEAMRRPYTLEQYSALVDDIRGRLPHAAIGSDVIVGFPGETDDDFDRLTAYLERSPLTHLHVFPYSDRPGTAASTLANKVHGSIVKARGERVRQISRRLQQRFRESLIGTIRPALTIEDGSVAITDNYIRVQAPAGHARNEWITATL
jgi:threonylcarbamoyladenosine tRNA methylthiotransferase MtaB